MKNTKKVNLGCGGKFDPSWINLDFHSNSKFIKKHNLLKRLPFDDNSIDFIYSSHVLEHFDRQNARSLIFNCYKKIKPGGILRIVVPDLENICKEYLTVLDQARKDPESSFKKYEWILIELLDQLTRQEPGGEMLKFYKRESKSNDSNFKKYIQQRTGVELSQFEVSRSSSSFFKIMDKIKNHKISTLFFYGYAKFLEKLTPKNIRKDIFIGTSFGEKHKWMYDSFSLEKELKLIGFNKVYFLDHKTSYIEDFNSSNLDLNLDGSPYKGSSLYCEAVK